MPTCKIITRPTKRQGITVVFIVLSLILLLARVSWADDTQVRIGVLAKRGIVRCLEKWSPTAEYLSDKIPDKIFVIVPIDSDGVFSFVEHGTVDFILANPSIYVELESLYGVNRIVTIKNFGINCTHTKYSGVVFCKANRIDIQHLSEINGKNFMGVSETSFGGWQMTWREFKQKGIDPYRDFKTLRFAGTQDAVVYAVRDGKVDAGTVRTDTLEKMEMEGKIDLKDFRVIHEHGGGRVYLPFRHSTRSYPEWPFSKVKHTPDDLAEKVAIALLEMPRDCAAAKAAKCAGWTIPLNYQPVHECLKKLKVGPYKDLGKITFADIFKKYWGWIIPIVFLFIVLAGITIFIQKLNRNIRVSHARLQKQVEERNRLVTAIEQAAESVIITDRDGTILYVNSAFESITGYGWQEAVGQNPRILKSEKLGKAFYADMWDTITSGRVWSGHFINKRKDGTLYEEEATISPVRNTSGNIINFVAVKRDLTEEIKLEEKLHQSQKMEAIGTLAGGIAHDFNNILSAIIGYTQLAEYDIPDESKARGSLTEVLNASRRAKDLVKQILAFSRQANQEQKPLQISHIAKEVLNLMRASLPSTIEIRRNIESDLNTVLADPTQIHQVLMNLCTNAAYDMKDSVGVLDVSLANVTIDSNFTAKHPQLGNGAYVRLTVSDTGHGMSDEVMDHIFDPYFTTKEKGGGTGLGLAVVHGIMKSHGGAITVESEVGKGSTFNVYLPAIEREVVKERDTAELIPTGHQRILFVDDEPALVDIGKKMLEHLGHEVITRTSSLEAVEAFRNWPDKFDLVITDKTMPQMTGFDLAKELKHIRPDIPILLCTGFSDTTDSDKVKAMGISGLVMKPIVRREMAESIKQVLHQEIGD